MMSVTRRTMLLVVLTLVMVLDAHAQTSEVVVCPSPCTCTEEQVHGMTMTVVNCMSKQLVELPDFTSLGSVHIYRINLDLNRLTTLPARAFAGLKVHGIQVGDNPITHIDAEAFTELDDYLEYLSLQRVRLAHPAAHFLHHLSSLRTLDLAGAIMLNVSLPSAFGTLPSLEVFVLKSAILTPLHTDAFLGLESVEEIRLDSCRLPAIPQALHSLTNLKSLHLDHNAIATIDANAFSHITALRVLTMQGNNIGNMSLVSPEAFAHVGSSLEELDLGANMMGRIPDHLLDGLHHLESLKLQDTGLQGPCDNCFDKLQRLKVLDLTGNSELEINKYTFVGLENSLEVLYLSGFQWTPEEIPLGSLAQLKSLKELHLWDNDFEVLPRSLFAGLSASHFGLRSCNIRHIDRDAFYGLPAGLTLDLNRNAITNLDFAVADPCQFTLLEVYNNPLNCTCEIRNLVFQSGIDFVGKCMSPEDMAGERLEEMSEPQFEADCPDEAKQTIHCTRTSSSPSTRAQVIMLVLMAYSSWWLMSM